MTLIVATRTPAGVSLFADWRLSYEDSPQVPNFKSGNLKLWVLRWDRCIGFAGNYEVAKSVLRGLTDKDVESIESLTTTLLEVHLQNPPGGLEFILATLDDPDIYKVAGGSIVQADTAWIGDYDAFAALQEYRHNSEAGTQPSSPVDERMQGWQNVANIGQAFENVLAKSAVSTVGELVISVATDEDGFIYAPKSGEVAGFRPQVIPSGHEQFIDFSDAATGGFAYTTMAARDMPAFALYFPHGRFGYFFYPTRLDAPLTFSETDQSDFMEVVRKSTGVALDPGIHFIYCRVNEVALRRGLVGRTRETPATTTATTTSSTSPCSRTG